MTDVLAPWRYFAEMSQEEYDARRRAAEDEGRIWISGGNRGVVYVYREYVHRDGDALGEFNEPTGKYVEQRWVMGKAPARQVWDYGRSELRRAYTAPAVRIA